MCWLAHHKYSRTLALGLDPGMVSSVDILDDGRLSLCDVIVENPPFVPVVETLGGIEMKDMREGSSGDEMSVYRTPIHSPLGYPSSDICERLAYAIQSNPHTTLTVR